MSGLVAIAPVSPHVGCRILVAELESRLLAIQAPTDHGSHTCSRGPNHTRRPGTDRTLVPSSPFSPGLRDQIKTRRGPFLFGVCLCGPSLCRIVKCFCSLYIACLIFVIKSALCIIIVNKYLLNVPVRCLSFLPLAQHGAGLRSSKAVRAVNCSFGPTDLGNRRSVYTRIGLGKWPVPPELRRGCGFPR